jgi:hypothetical protein
MSKPCNIVRNDLVLCDELAERTEGGTFDLTAEHDNRYSWRVRVKAADGSVALKFCPFCGASIVPPYTANEAP